MSDSAFKPLSTAERIFYEVVWTPMIKAGEIWIEGAVPFLALPVVKQLDEAAINALTDALFHQMTLFVDVTAIRMVDARRQVAWESASEKLSILAKEQGEASDAYKKALAAEADDFAKFVHTGPT